MYIRPHIHPPTLPARVSPRRSSQSQGPVPGISTAADAAGAIVASLGGQVPQDGAAGGGDGANHGSTGSGGGGEGIDGGEQPAAAAVIVPHCRRPIPRGMSTPDRRIAERFSGAQAIYAQEHARLPGHEDRRRGRDDSLDSMANIRCPEGLGGRPASKPKPSPGPPPRRRYEAGLGELARRRATEAQAASGLRARTIDTALLMAGTNPTTFGGGRFYQLLVRYQSRHNGRGGVGVHVESGQSNIIFLPGTEYSVNTLLPALCTALGMQCRTSGSPPHPWVVGIDQDGLMATTFDLPAGVTDRSNYPVWIEVRQHRSRRVTGDVIQDWDALLFMGMETNNFNNQQVNGRTTSRTGGSLRSFAQRRYAASVMMVFRTEESPPSDINLRTWDVRVHVTRRLHFPKDDVCCVL